MLWKKILGSNSKCGEVASFRQSLLQNMGHRMSLGSSELS